MPVQPIVHRGNTSDNFFRKRHTATMSFAMGVLLFLLPFAALKCSSVTLAENTGIGLVLGKEWKVAMQDAGNSLLKKAGVTENYKKDPFKTGPAIFAVLALLAGLLGLVFSISRLKARPLGGMCAGILAALMLIALMIQLRILMRSALKDVDVDNRYAVSMVLKIEFTTWYYLSVASFAAAALFSYKHHVIEMHDAMAGVVDFEFQLKDQQP